MRGEATVPVEWFGQFVPQVGDELEVVVKARVSKIEQEQIDVTILDSGTRGDTLGGEIRVEMVLTELKFPMSELDRLVAQRLNAEPRS